MLCYTSLPTNSVVLQNCGNNFVAVNLLPRPPPPTQNDHVSKPNPTSAHHTVPHAGSGRCALGGVAVRRRRSRTGRGAAVRRLPGRARLPRTFWHAARVSFNRHTRGNTIRARKSGAARPARNGANAQPFGGCRAGRACRAPFGTPRACHSTDTCAGTRYVRERATRAREGDMCAGGRHGCTRRSARAGVRRIAHPFCLPHPVWRCRGVREDSRSAAVGPGAAGGGTLGWGVSVVGLTRARGTEACGGTDVAGRWGGVGRGGCER